MRKPTVVTETRYGFLVGRELHDCTGGEEHAETCRRLQGMLNRQEDISPVFEITLSYSIPESYTLPKGAK